MNKILLNLSTLLFVSILFLNGCSSGGSDYGGDITPTTEKTVFDVATKFEWQDSSENKGDANWKNWQEAVSYCENLTYAGKEDWSLPTVELLLTIVDRSKNPPIVDGFQNIESHKYWSSTPNFWNSDSSGMSIDPDNAMAVGFDFNGEVNFYTKDNTFPVRCIRGGEFSDLKLSPYYGRWAYVDNAEVINISSTSATYFKEYELIDENLIKVGSRYLIRAGISDVKLTGELATISDSSSQSISRAYSSIGNMNIILKNIKQNKEVSVKIEISDDSSLIGKIINGILYVADPAVTGGRIVIPKNSDLTTPTGETEITLIDSSNNSAKFKVNVLGQETDLGVLTVTDKPYNFKSYIEHENDWKYFGYNDGESEISYTKTLKICNVGTESISGVSFEFELDSDANDIKRDFTTNYDGSAVPFSSGECKSYGVGFSFKRPIEDKDVKINITINDNFNTLRWDDYATIKLSQYQHHNLYFNSNTKELNGYLVAPGKEIINVAFSSSSSNNFVRVPLVQTDEYDVIISASNINDEDVYMISSGVEADTTKMNGFTDVTANEPDNNESSATKLALFEGEAVAYIEQGDIDFYKIVDIPYASSAVAKEYYVDFDISIPMVTDLNASTVTTDTIKVSTSTGIAIAGTTSYNQTTNILVFTPSQNFTAGVYKVTLDKDLQSATGYKLESDVSFNITVNDYPSTAQIIYSANDVDAYIQDITISENLIYLADSLHGLQILDISSPITPIKKGTFESKAYSVTSSGNYAYIYDVDLGVQIVDISNPSLPIFKSKYITSGGEINIAVAGDYAYIADSGAGLQILDISNPSLPTLKGSSFDANNAINIKLFGNHAYIAGGWTGLQIIDISNPTSPTLIKTLGEPIAENIAISGNYAYVVDSTPTFKIYDISNPTSPILKSSLGISNHALDIAVSGNHAFLVGDFGLKVINISNPSLPILKETLEDAKAWDIAISGNFAYIAHPHEKGLQIINIQMYQ